jgi:hypothetical protein
MKEKETRMYVGKWAVGWMDGRKDGWIEGTLM